MARSINPLKDPKMKPTTHIDAAAIARVRLRCNGCGMEVVIPVGISNVPTSCFNCNQPLPGIQVGELLQHLNWLKTAAANPRHGFDAAIEADSNDD